MSKPLPQPTYRPPPPDLVEPHVPAGRAALFALWAEDAARDAEEAEALRAPPPKPVFMSDVGALTAFRDMAAATMVPGPVAWRMRGRGR